MNPSPRGQRDIDSSAAPGVFVILPLSEVQPLEIVVQTIVHLDDRSIVRRRCNQRRWRGNVLEGWRGKGRDAEKMYRS
jgi:hypothetical protein